MIRMGLESFTMGMMSSTTFLMAQPCYKNTHLRKEEFFTNASFSGQSLFKLTWKLEGFRSMNLGQMPVRIILSKGKFNLSRASCVFK